MGLCMAMGRAFGLRWIFIGGPDIFAMGAEEMLNELVSNFSTSHALSLGMFSSVGEKGGCSGLSGVGCLGITSSSTSSSRSSLSVRPNTSAAGSGKHSGTHSRFLSALREMSVVFTPSAK